MPIHRHVKLGHPALQAFVARNPELDLLGFDFHDRKALQALKWDGVSREQAVAQLKRSQRLLRVVDTEETAAKLESAGLHSAHQIAAMSEARFVRRHGKLFAGEDQARATHRRAKSIQGKVRHLWANARDLVASRHFRATRFFNAQEELTDYFESIPSYQDLFGGLDYLECPHCRSVLGPAAYFVDLMRIADEYVTYPNTHKGSGNIPDGMRLEDRRPDLFTMPLDCASTDTVIPYLQVVNKVLEGKLKGDVYPQLALAAYPFNLPFNLPLTQVRLNLEPLKVTLAEAYGTFFAPLSAGAPQAGDATSITLAATASSENGYYTGMEVRLTAGPGAGQVRRIAGYDGAGRVARVAPDWATPPTTDSRYEVTDVMDLARERLGFSPEQYQYEITPEDEAAVAHSWGYSDLAGVIPVFKPAPGLIDFSAGSVDVTGDPSTHFDTELAVGDQIWCGPEIRSVASISSPTALKVDVPWSFSAAGGQWLAAKWARGPGVITIYKDSTQVTGDANAQLDRLEKGDLLQCAGKVRTVVEVRSPTELLVDSVWQVDAAVAKYTVSPASELSRMTTFLARTGLDRAGLDALLRQDTSPQELKAGVTWSFYINDTGELLPPLQLVTDLSDPDNSFQRIVGLSVKRLDRLSRFIRLQRQLGWSAANTNWLMDSVGAQEIDTPLMEALAVTQRLAASSGLRVDVLASFWHDLKTIGRVDEARPQDLFDRVYNNPALLRGQDPYKSQAPIPFDPARPLTWDIDQRTAGSQDATIRSRLLGALALSDDDLTLTAHFIRANQGQSGTSLVLDLGTLSWLYRLAKQAAWLQLSIDAYLTLLWMVFYPQQPRPLPPPKGAITADQMSVLRVQAAADWLRGSPFNVYSLRYILTGEQSAYFKQGFVRKDLRTMVDALAASSKESRLGPAALVFEDIRADQAQALFESLQSLGFVSKIGIVTDKPVTYDAIAALFPVTEASFITQNIDPAQSAEAFQALATHQPPYLIVAGGETSGTLSEIFTPETSLDFLFPDDPLQKEKQAEVRAILLQVRRDIDHTLKTLVDAAAAQEGQAAQGVADFVGVTRELLSALLAFSAGVSSLAAQRVALLTPLAPDEDVPQAVVDLIDVLWRAALWAQPLAYTPDELATIAADPAPFGIADTKALTFPNLRTLERFRFLTLALGDQNGVLLQYFKLPQAEGVVLLSGLTGWKVPQLEKLLETFWPAAGGTEAERRTVDGVLRLKAAFDVCDRTGTDAFYLLDLQKLLHLSVGVVGGSPVASAWADYEAQAGRTLDALSGRYGDGFEEVYAPLAGKVDTAKRDALLGYTLWSLNPDFPFLRTPADLYQFLLIDVEMSDCAVTSLIAQGISSVQLYLQRCRMGLEPGVTELDVDPVWWEWLSAYRVWEANRKIFLYPENYLQPALRSGQSPEFRKLAEALLQTDLTEAGVTEAYLKYFDGLDLLANLVPIASHRADTGPILGDSASARTFLFARTGTDPYTYYWRTHDELDSWSPWLKVDLSINAPEVAPVYAFDQLFLFWSELDTGKTTSIADAKSDPRYVRNASIKYSFFNVGGQWVQPQMLAANVPTDLGPNAYPTASDPVIAAALTPSSLYWRQPYPLDVARGLPGTGRILVTKDLYNATGTGTHFKREVRVGDRISVGGQTRVVGVVVDDTNLAVLTPWSRSSVNSLFKVIPENQNENAFPSFNGAGTVQITAGLGLVTGAGTRFKQEVSVGDRILCANEVRTVVLVDAENNLLAEPAWTVTRTGEPYTVIPAATGAESLVVLYGASLATALTPQAQKPVLPANPGKDTFLQQQEIFDYGLFYATSLAQEAGKASPPIRGDVTLSYAALLDADLQVQPSRVLVSNYQYSANDNPQPYRYRLDRAERLLRAAPSQNAVSDNYWGNSAPGTPRMDLPPATGRNLLYNVSAANGSLRNVGNQLGWAVFDNGDEAFLVRSSEENLDRLSDMVIRGSIPDPELGEALLLSASSFTSTSSDFNALDFAFTRITTSVVSRLRQRLFAGGIDRLLTVESQLLPELPFNRFYQTPSGPPPPHVIPPLTDRLDFEGAYGLYFQEVFLFAPWLIADRLQAEQRFDDAKRWYQYIFDPTARPTLGEQHPNDRYWRYLPFRDVGMDTLVGDLTDPKQVQAYNDQPFDPDAIARLRPAAYPKAVVLDYIDNLLRWGDFLFAQDTSESINQATQLYVLASELLGPRPQAVGVCPVPQTQNFNDIRATYGQDIPQFLIDLENGVPAVMNDQEVAYRDVPINDIQAYFCVPENAELIQYWDRVDDRLFKIRHCMNIQGQERSLALFAPPLDPNALIRAAASSRGGPATAGAGVAPLPAYRFTAMLEKAKAFTAGVVSLGAEMLAALEKKDAERLALLRTGQERALLELNTQIKEQQIQQAVDTGRSLEDGRLSAAARREFYTRMIQTGLSPEERQNLVAMEAGLVFSLLASVATTASSIAYTIPQVGSPFAMTYGGIQVGSALAASATVFEVGSAIASYNAQKSLSMAGYQRRNEEWELQRTLADLDEKSIAAQIASNDLQRQIAERELQINSAGIAQSRELEAYLQKKFTNEELYQWMAGRLSEVYFQSWLLALDLARATERAFQYELNTSRAFLDFVYWDSPRKGLLAGEGLGLALGQMEKAYTDGNVRTLEIEKTISLAQLSPRSLLDFKATGECTFDLPERLFDFDFPGHYCRKLKTVSVTLPAVVGPYQTVHATLTQLGSQVVLKPDIQAIQYLLGDSTQVPGPDALRSNVWTNQQVSLSRGTGDSGMFQLDFNDPRYLPFEGTGAVSSWRLSMPPQTNRFDFSTITDVLIQLDYTALDGGAGLRKQVTQQPQLKDYAGSPLLSLAQVYSQQWFAFMTDHADPALQTLQFPVPPGIVPPHLKDPKLVGFFFQLIADPPGAGAGGQAPYIRFQVTSQDAVSFKLNPKDAYYHQFDQPLDMSAVFQGDRSISFLLGDTPAQLKAGGFLDPKVVKNIALVLYYRATVTWP